MCYDVVSGERERRKQRIVDQSSLRWLAGWLAGFPLGSKLVASGSH